MQEKQGQIRPDGLRPQSVMFSFLGIHLLGTERAVSTSAVIEVLSRVGISEEAGRATLTRMARRGLLERHRHGRQVHFTLTQRAVEVLEDGRRRVWETGAIDPAWDGSWTTVGFSLPEGRRSERHDLRVRLTWEGFGMLQNGMWVAPGARDLDPVLGPLAEDPGVVTLISRVTGQTDDHSLLERVFDLDAISQRYAAFARRWSAADTARALPDDLARQLVLHTEWLQVIRDSPRLPSALLPPQPAMTAAQDLFLGLAATLEPGAAKIASRLFDTNES